MDPFIHKCMGLIYFLFVILFSSLLTASKVSNWNTVPDDDELMDMLNAAVSTQQLYINIRYQSHLIFFRCILCILYFFNFVLKMKNPYNINKQGKRAKYDLCHLFAFPNNFGTPLMLLHSLHTFQFNQSNYLVFLLTMHSFFVFFTLLVQLELPLKSWRQKEKIFTYIFKNSNMKPVDVVCECVCVCLLLWAVCCCSDCRWEWNRW